MRVLYDATSRKLMVLINFQIHFVSIITSLVSSSPPHCQAIFVITTISIHYSFTPGSKAIGFQQI